MAMPGRTRRAASRAGGLMVAGCCAVLGGVYFADSEETMRSVPGVPKLATSQGVASAATERGGPAAAAPFGRTVELRAGAHGHYHADALINGRRIDVLVDTGASQVALTFEDARRAGIHVGERDFNQLVRTANGVARVAPITLERVSIGDISVRDVPAWVSAPGMLATSLLGMSFLKRLKRLDMRGGTLILQD